MSLVAIVGGCGSSPTASPVSVSGVVIAVDGPSAAQVDRFSLRTDEGAVIQFEVGRLDVSNGALPAPHLREHLVSGEPIRVDYQVVDGRHVALRYADAAP